MTGKRKRKPEPTRDDKPQQDWTWLAVDCLIVAVLLAGIAVALTISWTLYKL